MALAVALLLSATIGATGMLSRGVPGATATSLPSRPNVVVIETDDQTAESMKVMSRVNAQIADKGVTFPDSFVNFSRCCPSRATFLTGEYAHNHRIRDNLAPQGGFEKFQRLHGHNNLAVWLQRAGYRTALIGKYLNGYLSHPIVPPGWSVWDGGLGGAVYDYDVNQNGKIVHYGTDRADFKQDVLTRRARHFIEGSAQRQRPFFLWLTYSAPHTSAPDPNPQPPFDCDGAAKPAARDADAFASEPLPLPPSFNESDVSDKPRPIRRLPLLTDPEIAEITRKYRCALESLLSVDDGVGHVLDELQQTGELANTYVIYTSDNGYFNGEHRIKEGKTNLYEESIRVPLLIRGPTIPRGRTVNDLATNADLAPTIVKLTGAKANLAMDGRSLVSAARHPRAERGRELSVESTDFTAIRTQRYVYGEYRNGEKELYDLAQDPYELQNDVTDPAYRQVKAVLARRLHKLAGCSGQACRLRPRVELRLHYRTRREDGRRCATNRIRARLEGTQKGDAVKTEFYVGHELVGEDSGKPFKLVMPAVHGRTRLGARVTMLDGRRLTLGRHLRACG